MTGQNIKARRVVVLAEDESGGQIGWDVFDVDEMSWRWLGVGSDGSRARVVVGGSFHRINKNPNDPFQQAFDNQAAIEAARQQLGGGSDGG